MAGPNPVALPERPQPPGHINVLMYHSIADGAGPTSIAPGVFARQMRALADSGCTVVPFSAVGAWLRERVALPYRPVAITFDDGFADFVPAARVLQQHGFHATVFLPTARMGQLEDWSGTGSVPRPLMTWDDVRALARDGVEFGGHSLTHPDLTSLAPDAVEREVRGSRDEIEERLGRPPATFAAPYGASSPAVRQVIARWYAAAAGTDFDRVTPGSDAFDIPRIEMYYFRDGARFGAFLDGRAEWYFRARQAARTIGRQVRAVTASR